jgi:probable phosphoglycerate mutase
MNGNLFEPAASAGDVAGEWLTAHCDGGSRGNPGPSGYGAVIEDGQGRILARLSEYLGRQTNNYAEYAGLLAVLRWALQHGHKRLRVVSDSELMVKQMKGQYKVASPGLRPLWEDAKRMAARLDRFEMRHTLRGGNKEADQLANEAMDLGTGRVPSQPVSAVGGVSASANQSIVPPAGAASPRPAPQPPAKPVRQILEGYVKDGVVHLLEGELPDGIFVKIIRE